LESVCTFIAYRGFESHSLRQPLQFAGIAKRTTEMKALIYAVLVLLAYFGLGLASEWILARFGSDGQ
jgi:hypothetical protein